MTSFVHMCNMQAKVYKKYYRENFSLWPLVCEVLFILPEN